MDAARRRLLREHAPALAAFGAIALHLVDDAFLQPEPGVAAADHVPGGLVPVALVAAAAAAYPYLRPGARGALALTVGLLALGTGIAVPVLHTVREGPSGDDFTGLLGTAGGLVLAVVGTATLWRSRRGGSRARRYARRAALAIAAVLVASQLVLPVGIGFVATHKARSSVAAADLGRPHEEVTLRTDDGLALAGWYVPSRNGAAVIAFPGRSGPVDHARMLVRHGYGVLLLDRRGEGESDGEVNLLGWGGASDLRAAVAYLRARPDVEPARVGGLGLSVGGELLLEAAARDPGLRAVVSEGAGVRSLREVDELPGGERWRALPQWALLTAATAVFANRLPPPGLDELVGRISPRAVLLVYAGHGQGGEEANPRYHAAAGEPKELWELPEAGHTGGLDARPEEYERRVVGFFDRYLLGRG
jgi:hypothetical protein